MDYKEIIENIILPNEGVYSNDINDPGGETCYGISRKHFPKWEGWDIIDELKNKDDFIYIIENNNKLKNYVINFYKKFFWDKLYLDKINNNLKQKIILDTAVNIGVKRTIIMIQKVLKVDQDGIIGPITINKLNNIDNELFISKFKLERISYYVQITSRNYKLRKYFYGWIRRTIKD